MIAKGADFQISLLPPQPFLQLAEIKFLKKASP
jgi:hypothetical protein